ncbi:AsmA family protein [Roseixanthobacter glucoisosaccharinicivorans]|uniref:AsmA family protein n=1 Tax=Roseixanthobacter glucoisosaccharinicivorans TaxID=3119923 RepID=UPI003728CC9D
MRWLVRLAAVAAAALLLMVAAVVALTQLPGFAARRQDLAERFLRASVGPDVEVRGAVSVDLFPRFTARLGDVTVLDVAGAGVELHLQTVALTLTDYPALLGGFAVDAAEVEGVRILLPMVSRPASGPDSGSGAAPLALPAADAPLDAVDPTSQPVTARIVGVLTAVPTVEIRDLLLEEANHPQGWNFALRVDSLSSTYDSVAGAQRLSATGTYNGEAVTLNGTLDREAKPADGRFGTQIALVTRGLELDLAGSAASAAFDRDLALQVTARSASIGDALQLLSLARAEDGTARLDFTLAGDPGALAVKDLSFAATLAEGETLTIAGALADLQAGTGLSLSFRSDLLAPGTTPPVANGLRDIVITGLSGFLEGDLDKLVLRDMLIQTNAFEQSIREVGPISVRAVERTAKGQVRLRGITLQAGPRDRPVFRLKGTVDDVLQLDGVVLSGAVDLPVADLLSAPGTGLGRIVGTLDVSDTDGTIGVDALDGRIADSSVMSGTLSLVRDDTAGPRAPHEIRLASTFEVPDFGAFAAQMGASSASNAPVTFSGLLSASAESLKAEGKASLGRTEITGVLSSSLGPGRTVLEGKLTSPLVYVDELAALAEASRDAVEADRARRSAATQDKADPKTEPQIDLTRLVDLDLDISANRLNSAGDSASGLKARLTLDKGMARLDPFSASYMGGRIKAAVQSDLTASPMLVRAKGTVDGWPLSTFLNASNVGFATQGRLKLAFDMSVDPTSDAALMRTLNGTVSVGLTGGRLATGKLDLAGLGIIAGLFNEAVRSDSTALRCVSVPLSFTSGVARTTPALVIETDHVRVVGRGTIDLPRNTINIYAEPRPLNGRENDLGYPFAITGALSSPQVGTVSRRPDARLYRLGAGCKRRG